MLTSHELDTIRARMEDEHRKDVEALERVKRFLPAQLHNEATALKPSLLSTDADPNLNILSSGAHSILGTIEDVMESQQDRTWTVQQLIAALESKGVELKAKNPMATVGVAIKKLLDRGKVKLARRGAGREPHIYQWKKINIDDCVVTEGERMAS